MYTKLQDIYVKGGLSQQEHDFYTVRDGFFEFTEYAPVNNWTVLVKTSSITSIEYLYRGSYYLVKFNGYELHFYSDPDHLDSNFRHFLRDLTQQ